MVKKSIRFAAYAVMAAGAYGMSVNEASAAGCNGVVDQFKWGCAAWDNNNGPQFPHYKAPKKAAPPAARSAPAPQVQRPAVVPNTGHGIISRDGAGLIGADGSTLRRR